MSIRQRLLQHPLLEPLSLAAWAAWGVVWFTTLQQLHRLPAWQATLMHICLWLFLACFVLVVSRTPARPLPPPIAGLVTVTMAAAALFVSAERSGGSSPILLVLLATVLGQQLRGRWLWLAMTAVNSVFLGILYTRWGARGAELWITLAAYCSFQAFAALVVSTARRAEDLAENLQSINAELLTTRTLLAEAARDQERLTLSRELHDVAGHSLTALKLNLGAMLRDPAQPDRERVELCAGLADELLQNLRGVVQAMRAEPESEIEPALRRLAIPFPRPRLELDVAADAQLLRAADFETVLRAVQEALTNAARHGPATLMQVTLRRESGELLLDIEDDGRIGSLPGEGGGLSGMRERVEQRGGSLALARGALGGLHLRARLPLGGTT